MTSTQLTKSDFLSYRQCAKALWLKKRKPNAVAFPPPSLFDQLLMQDGYRVEEIVKQLVADWPDAEACEFQTVFETPDGLYARADLVRTHSDGSLDIYEIKGSTSLKSSTGQDHVDDAAFQVMVAERAGYSVRAAHIIHVKKDFVRRGAIEPLEFLTIVDVTAEARTRLSTIEADAESALSLLAKTEIDERGCSCRMIGSRDKQCASFSYFNPDIPAMSIYLLPRISKNRIVDFLGDGRLALSELDPSELTPMQVPVLLAAQRGEPQVDVDGIKSFLNGLVWPLYFYDYETFASAIPISDGLRPQQKMPVQYSLHRLSSDGTLEHFEFLSDRPGMQLEMVTQMQQDFGSVGGLVSWNMSFEKSCNTALSELFPQAATFLNDLNARTVDLMDVFKKDYVDIRFEGSTSIKKVLPVLCPHLQYNGEAVHDGGGAMAAWLELVETSDDAEKLRIASELRAYCELDTLAMVEIYRFLERITANGVPR
tara:strand:+ start:2765 stop:4213 length:1449 start_codon:yes stop_codon:yes gene_type:complete